MHHRRSGAGREGPKDPIKRRAGPCDSPGVRLAGTREPSAAVDRWAGEAAGWGRASQQLLWSFLSHPNEGALRRRHRNRCCVFAWRAAVSYVRSCCML